VSPRAFIIPASIAAAFWIAFVVSMIRMRARILAESPELAGRLGRQARERIAAHFSIERSLSRLWSIIEAARR
jgi:glycosyltransferase involved in cell wall biosynthesis